jgi:hypothetical protein
MESSLKLDFLSHFLENLSFISGDEKPVFMPDKFSFAQYFQILFGNIKV